MSDDASASAAAASNFSSDVDEILAKAAAMNAIVAQSVAGNRAATRDGDTARSVQRRRHRSEDGGTDTTLAASMMSVSVATGEECVCYRVMPAAVVAPMHLHCQLCRRAFTQLSVAALIAVSDSQVPPPPPSQVEHLNVEVDRLRAALAQRDADVDTLRQDMHALSTKLVREVEKRAELQAERDKISEELEELTRTLFEQANVLVAGEARRRHETELLKQSLQQRLDATQRKLRFERYAVVRLRRQLSDYCVATLRSQQEVAAVRDLTFDVITSPPSSPDAHPLPALPLASLAKADAVVASAPELGRVGAASETAVAAGKRPARRRPQVIDSFTSLDVDLLPDRRFYDEFRLLVDRMRSFPLNKAPGAIPFLKHLLDEHVEPCARLPRLSSRKIMDALMNGTMRVNRVESCLSSDPEISISPRSSSPVRGSPARPVTPPNSDVHTFSRASQRIFAPPSPPRPPSWFGGGNSAAMSGPALCGGCGREGTCEFRISIVSSDSGGTHGHNNSVSSLHGGGGGGGGHAAIGVTTSSFSSALSAKLDLGGSAGIAAALHGCWLDSACRDRLYSVWQFYNFLRRLRRLRAAPRTEDDIGLIVRRSNAAATQSWADDADDPPFNSDSDLDDDYLPHDDGESDDSDAEDTIRDKLHGRRYRHNDENSVDRLYAEFLRHLRQMFYARIGVMSYFMRLEQPPNRLPGGAVDSNPSSSSTAPIVSSAEC